MFLITRPITLVINIFSKKQKLTEIFMILFFYPLYTPSSGDLILPITKAALSHVEKPLNTNFHEYRLKIEDRSGRSGFFLGFFFTIRKSA